ncbi:preprotein translocase subunit YajC [Gracilibacillus halotolerans]|uniref:Preprotein translocase subunit YajC n=1 Tax=Gracilibacillus halotolerans TaxID=74386 RepID=A0A841RJ17_9BACI|nr:YcxB family protein [Gracilibacillus halotolerans]MBB6511867.1 preprotein translocase subunit YajC [Gracilibacillus halotolerans]
MDNNITHEINASGTYSREEVEQLNSFLRKRISILIFVVTMIYCLIPSELLLDMPVIIRIPLVLLFAFLITFIFMIILKNRARKQYNNDRLVKLERNFKITCKGITHSSEASHVSIEWDDIAMGFELNKIFIVIYFSNNILMLPKRFFSSKEDELLFKKIVSENIKIKLKRDHVDIDRNV